MALFVAACLLIFSIAQTGIQSFQQDAQTLPWWKSMSIYNVYVKSFKDSNGDGVGDLNGITQKLNHFVDLGVDIVWLTPFSPSPGVDHGYDVSDYKSIDPTYGTMDDFVELIRQMKKLGLKFMMDLVVNHCSDQHIWFQKSKANIKPYSDYFIWRDPKGYDRDGTPIPPNNWTSLFLNSAWEWVESRKQFYYHIFSKNQPDFNMRNPQVLEELKDILRFWIDRGVSGFRLDAPKFYFEDKDFKDEQLADSDVLSQHWNRRPSTADLIESYELVRDWKHLIENEYTSKDGEERILIVEVYSSLELTQQWFDYAHLAYNFYYGMMVNRVNAKHLDMVTHLWNGVTSTYMTDTHDFARTAQKFGDEFVDNINMIITMLPGNVAIYYGQEIGMTGINLRPEQIRDRANVQITRDAVRTPMQWDDSLNAGFTTKRKPWLPVNPNYWRINLESEKTANVSHYQVLKSLMELRRTPTVKYGGLNTYVLSDWVWAFTRTFESAETYVIVLNLGTEMEVIDLSGIQNLPAYLKVVIPTINSGYKAGDRIWAKPKLGRSTYLRPKSGLVLTPNVQQEPDESS